MRKLRVNIRQLNAQKSLLLYEWSVLVKMHNSDTAKRKLELLDGLINLLDVIGDEIEDNGVIHLYGEEKTKSADTPPH